MNGATDIQQFQFLEKYSRWDYTLGRRETYGEAVDRTIEWAKKIVAGRLNSRIFDELKAGMMSMDAFPSMRLFQTAGVEAERHPEAIFNCSYLTIQSIDDFAETLYLLGLGVGVGYSVEKYFVDQLPVVKPLLGHKWVEIVVEDSIEGWRDAYRAVLKALFDGIIPLVDYSKIRPEGAPLRTRGGVASGAGPLSSALGAIFKIFDGAQGRKLTPLEVHDIQCYIASAIVSGGYRRSAMICLFDADDEEMLHCKDTANIANNKQRYFANNSIIVDDYYDYDWWREKLTPGLEAFSGEPGIVSRKAMMLTIPSRRDYHPHFGVNPCGEVILRPMQFCNLSIANVRANDSISTILEKVRLAAIWGTIMASVDNFAGLRGTWAENQKDERLIAVDLNGQRDNALFNDDALRGSLLKIILAVVNSTNADISKQLGIRQAAASTCAKPAGNSATLFNTASGCHARFSKYYIRRVQCKNMTPMSNFLLAQGVPFVIPDGVDWTQASTLSFEFPIVAPNGAVFIDDLTAIDQLNYWRDVKINYTEHNPSVTISYSQHEIDGIIQWIYQNQFYVTGISYFPRSDSIYRDAPYEAISHDKYKELVEQFPVINWDSYHLYDNAYFSEKAQEYACVSGACEFGVA